MKDSELQTLVFQLTAFLLGSNPAEQPGISSVTMMQDSWCSEFVQKLLSTQRKAEVAKPPMTMHQPGLLLP